MPNVPPQDREELAEFLSAVGLNTKSRRRAAGRAMPRQDLVIAEQHVLNWCLNGGRFIIDGRDMTALFLKDWRVINANYDKHAKAPRHAAEVAAS